MIAEGTSPRLYVAVMGVGAVGKTALVNRFIQNRFIDTYDPTIEESHRKHIQLDGSRIVLDILDTAGQEEYASMRDQYIKSGMGFMLVYSILDRNSLDVVQKLQAEILEVKGKPKVPMVLVGNKLDLAKNNLRLVPTANGKAMAHQFGGVPFFETSAKDGTNVDEAWMTLARVTRKAEGRPVLDANTATFSRGCCILL